MGAGGGDEPGLQSVDQHHAASRGLRGCQQQGVVAAGANARYGAAGETSKSICCKPFGIKGRKSGRHGVHGWWPAVNWGRGWF